MSEPDHKTEDEARDYCLAQLEDRVEEIYDIVHEWESTDYRHSVIRMCAVFVLAELTRYRKTIHERN